MSPIALHYDCDPGQDDAIALLYALGSPEIDVRSISVVGGNVDVNQCARNVLQLLELSGFTDIPVYVGADKPLERELKTLPHVFGETGMAGLEDLPTPGIRTQSQPAHDFLTGDFDLKTLVATAPLTNLAKAIQADTGFAPKIETLVIMGGCPHPEPVHGLMGNYPIEGADDLAEYNFAMDPEAAEIVFQSSIGDIVMMGLNVTRAALYNEKADRALRRLDRKVATAAANMLNTVGEEDHTDYADVKKSATDPVRAMHDLLAMVYLDRPDVFEMERKPVKIVTGGSPNAAGQSLIDNKNPSRKDVAVARKVDRDALVEALVENLKRLP